MSRFLSSLIPVIFIILAVFLPVYPAGATTPDRVTISVLMPAPDAAEWKPFIERFHAEQERVRLKIIEGPTSPDPLEDLYTTSFLLGRSPYDLVLMDIVWTSKFAAAGWLRPLDDLIPPSELNEFLEGDVDAGRYENNLYRLPLRSDAGMLYYRTDLLAKAGYSPPETFGELIKISRDLQQRGLARWGYLWQGKQYEGLSAMFVEILAGFGGFWIKPDTLEVGLDLPPALNAVNFLMETIQNDISPPGVTTYAEEDTRRIFQNGEAVFLRNWPYVFSLANLPESKIKGKFAIKPMVHAPDYRSGSCLGGWGLGIATTTPHPAEAREVIKFLTREDIQRDFILATSKVPTRKALFNDPAIVAKYPHYPELLKVVENPALRPPIAQYAKASDILQRYLSSALTGRLSPREALERAARETRLMLR